MLAGVIAMLAACVHSKSVAPGPPDAFVGIPNLRFSYYEVDGFTAEQIRRSINEGRPTDSHDGQRVDALSEWTIGWQIPSRGRSCDFQSARVTFAATVILPRHSNPSALAEPLRAHWDAYVASLRRHEDWHVRYAFEHLRDVEAAISASDCAAAQSAAAAAVRTIAGVERDYDLRARHTSEIIPFP